VFRIFRKVKIILLVFAMVMLTFCDFDKFTKLEVGIDSVIYYNPHSIEKTKVEKISKKLMSIKYFAGISTQIKIEQVENKINIYQPLPQSTLKDLEKKKLLSSFENIPRLLAMLFKNKYLIQYYLSDEYFHGYRVFR